MCRKIKNNLFLFLLVAFLVELTGLTPAKAYSLDTAFGNGGKVLTDFGDADAFISIFHLLEQSDGKIVAVGVAGNSHLASMRFNRDGTLDRSFGGDGKVILNITQHDSQPVATLDDNGKIIIAGRGGYDHSINNSQTLIVARLNQDGTLDSSFQGQGYTQYLTPSNTPYVPFSIAADNDHRIIVTGLTASYGGQGFVLRLTAAGAVDATFDGDGVALPVFSSSSYTNACMAVATDAQNRILLAGSANSNLVTARLLTNGAFDTSFDGDGFVMESGIGLVDGYLGLSGTRIEVLADGRIVTTGVAVSDFVQTRFLPDGTRDTTLNGTGYASLRLGENQRAYRNDIAPDGTVTLAAVTQEAAEGEAARYSVRMARFSPSGALVTDFGQAVLPPREYYEFQSLLSLSDGGVMLSATTGLYPNIRPFLMRLRADAGPDDAWNGGTVSSSPLSNDELESMTLDAKGRLVAAGKKEAGSGIARYLSDGKLDPSFGEGGRVLFGTVNHYNHQILCYPDGRILVASTQYDAERTFYLRRLREDGSPDTTFGNGGQLIVPPVVAYGPLFSGGLAFSGDGKFVVGFSELLARFHSDGRLDETFGTGDPAPGFQRVYGLRNWSDMVQDQAGRFVVLGRAEYGNIGVARFTPQGALDASFDGDGFKEIDLGTDYSDYDLGLAITVAPDGKILIGGYTERFNRTANAASSGKQSHTARVGTRALYARAALLRLHPNGSFDNSFSEDGVLFLPTTTARYYTDLAVEKSGDIWGAIYREADFGLVHVRANGTLDSSLGNGGVLDIDFGGNEYSNNILLDEKGRIVLGGQSDAGGTTDFALARVDFQKVSISDATISEGHTGTKKVHFAVTLTPASLQSVSINYSTLDATAKSGEDYTAVQGTLTFAPGETTKMIEAPLLGDTLHENDEFFRVSLSSPVNARIEKGHAIGTILNDDRAPSATINDASLMEGNDGFKNAVFTVELSAASATTVALSAIPYAGLAQTPGDFTSGGTRFVFAPGQTSKTFMVPIKGDLLHETDETFFVVLSSPSNCSIGRGRGTGTIIDDDRAPTLSINDVSLTEGNSGTKSLVLTVALSVPSGQVINVNYATANGIARSGSDYVAQNGVLSFSVGQTSKTIRVPVIGDVQIENDESLYVLLTGAVNATISKARGTGIIVNDDAS